MKSALTAGFVYFLGIFAVGFILGACRTIFVAPRTGEWVAVLLELPIVLTASWWLCRRLLHRFAVTSAMRHRAIMGASAFFWLMLAEYLLTVFGFNRSPAEFLDYLQTLPGAIGLAGQVIFGLMPLLPNRRRS